MKILHKDVTVGEYSFGISVDRDIIADSFEKFPELMEVLLKYADNSGEPSTMVVKAIKDKNLRAVLETTEKIAELVKYAFPRMLAKADEYDHTENAKISDEIMQYVIDNEADDVFNSEMFNFICLGFTPDTAEKKPKVKIVMK